MSTERLDLGPLLDPMPKEAVRAYRRRMRGAGVASSALAAVIPAVVAVVVIAVVAIVLIGVLGSQRSPVQVLALAVGVVAVVVAVRGQLSAASWRSWATLDRFASANGMRFTPRTAGSDEIGMLFDRGHDRITSELMRLGDGWLAGRVETANYRYSITTGSGKNRRTRVHRWAYLVIQLDRHLPQLVLDAVQNDDRIFGVGASNLGTSFSGRQRLSLEGDFDRYFRLFVPEGYERDALTVLTPDLMALLIDQAGRGAALDVEIVDDRLYFYAPGTLDYTDPVVWQRLTGIVRTVGAKTLKQTVRYADERVGDRAIDVVAPEGRRLRRGGALGGVAIVVVVAIAWWVLVSVLGR